MGSDPSKSAVTPLTVPRASHTEVQALKNALDQTFRGLSRALSGLFPGCSVEAQSTAALGGDLELAHDLGHLPDNIFPIMVRVQALPGWYAKSATTRTITIHVDGPIDARFWVT